jgi:hypothetical protein
MFCSKCFSPNIQKLSLVHESGVAHISTSSSGVGVGVGVGGVGVGVGGGSTRGTHVSATALRAAPPPRKQTSAAVWVLIFVVAALIAFANHAYLFAVLFLGGVALGVVAIRNVGLYNRSTWPQLYAYWDASYLCQRCGEMGPPVTSEPKAVTTIDHEVLPSEPQRLPRETTP